MQYFDDIPIGQKEMVGQIELTKSDIIEFAKLWDPQPFHLDERAAQESPFRGLTASGSHIFCVAARLTHKLKRVALIAGLGQELRFPNPARPRDRLTLNTECVDKRESRSKADRGIVVYEHRLTNQDGVVVLEMKSTILVAKRQNA
jgi:acyl dehydratase